MEYRRFTTSDSSYSESLQLRNRFLRRPIGLDLFDEDLSQESEQFHFGAFEGHQLAGCVLLVKTGESTGKLRQLVVEGTHRGEGLGSTLVRTLEDFACQAGLVHIEMAARVGVADFYRRLGYQTEGSEFIEVGIPHRRMYKTLY